MMTLGEHQQKFSRHVCMLFLKAFELGYEIRCGEFLRPIEMQQLYFKNGSTKTMESKHLKKCAADLHFVKNGVIVYPQELGDYWESLDPLNQWGGNWKNFRDQPHFQRTV